jgi:plasmid replication initiation protein
MSRPNKKKTQALSANQGVHLIKKSNQLIEARYKFDAWETRMFLSVLAQIRKEDIDFQTYRIWYGDVIKVFGLKSNQSYALLREGAKSLMRQKFFVSSSDGGFERETAFHIIRTVNYLKEGQEGSGVEQQEYIDITVEPEMKPLLLQLQQNFTAYDLQNVAKLSPHSLRLYELLKQYERIGERTLEITYMRRILELEKEYPLFADFYKWLIKPAVRDITLYTDISVAEPEKIKDRKKVAALKFKIVRKHKDTASTIQPLLDGLEKSSDKASKNSKEPSLLYEYANSGIIAPTQNIVSEEEIKQEYFEKLNDWWGIEKEAFFKRVGEKTSADIEAAIDFTKSRIKLGKAENPAGVFLEALTKGHKTAEQIQAQKKTEKERLDREKVTRLKPLAAQYTILSDEYAQALNDTIRILTQADPSVTNTIIERIKSQFRSFGDKRVEDKSLDDFRKNPLLRNLVKREIMVFLPEKFHAVCAQYEIPLKDLRDKILAIDPKFKFE